MAVYKKFNPDNLPPPILTGKPNSFAYKTMTTRIPAIIQNVIMDHQAQYPPAFVDALQNLRDEIVKNRPVQPLSTSAPDGESWHNAWRLYYNRTWLDIPWFFAEAYFYRRLLEAVDYFGDSEWAGVDPYLPRKQAELTDPATWQLLELALRHAADNSPGGLRALLHYAVWGNRVDLSYTQVAQDAGRQVTLEQEQANLLVDDADDIVAYLEVSREDNLEAAQAGERGESVQFICDNAGAELLMDLALADFLLRGNWCDLVVLHVKAYPTFVSDATSADVQMSLDALKQQPSTPIATLAGRLSQFRQAGRLLIQADSFWNSHHFFWELPPALHAELGRAALVIIKGDANYRRLLGDSRAWDPTTPINDAIPYFPAPFAALRTLKSDPIIGLGPGRAEALDREDPEWRVNGKRGLIQFRY